MTCSVEGEGETAGGVGHRLMSQIGNARSTRQHPMSRSQGHCANSRPHGESAGMIPLELVSQVATILSPTPSSSVVPTPAMILQVLPQKRTNQDGKVREGMCSGSGIAVLPRFYTAQEVV